MLAREKSQREEGSQKGGREKEKKGQMWPQTAQNKAREVISSHTYSMGAATVAAGHTFRLMKISLSYKG
jgi:hypothetical protein